MTAAVRVRYAPSPTGDPHLGSIRTALFNWLYARHCGGVFVFRIEDTDQERLVPGSVESLVEGLKWLGLDWDEGPTGVGRESKGPFGPYFQSDRKPLYYKYAEQLVAEGKAYRCFCSPARLDAVRRAQMAAKQPPGYDRHCRDLSEAERRKQEDAGVSSVVRFRIPLDGETTVHDLIRGTVIWENRTLDDLVLLKSDGFPTYHLANIVDDHHMEITHVMRAEEWLPSTPRHLLLYQAFGWEPPRFAHLPLILGSDRSKLSKRHGATSVLEYRKDGYLPEAMINFLALLGWSLDDKTEIISRAGLVANFSMERITKSPAIFNAEKLQWMNGMYIRAMPAAEVADRLLPFLERPAAQGGLPDSVQRPLDRAYVQAIVPLIHERLRILSEGPELTEFFFQDALAYSPDLLVQKGMDRPATRETLKRSRRLAEGATSWTTADLEPAFRALADELQVKTGQLFGAVRVAVTGRTATPPLFQTMEVLGKARCLERLAKAVDSLAA
jgi:glutamyl-tRNA synthetase